MAGETGTLPPEVQEKLTRLEKLEKDNAALGYKLRHWEGFGKRFENIAYDEQGLPLDVKGTEEPPPVMAGSHPLAGFATYAGEGWRPEVVDQYYLGLLGQKGYLTKPEAQTLAQQYAQAYANQVLGNAMVWRMHDKLTAQPDYKDLANKESELAKRTAKYLQERNYGKPLQETWRGFDEWQYGDLGHLQLAADLARVELAKEAATTAASAQAAAGAQAAGNLSPAAQPAAGGTPPGKPDFSQLKTAEDIVNALAEVPDVNAPARTP